MTKVAVAGIDGPDFLPDGLPAPGGTLLLGLSSRLTSTILGTAPRHLMAAHRPNPT